MHELAPLETQERIGYPVEGRWLDSGSGRRGRGRGTRGRGGRGRGRGGRRQRGLTSSRPDLLEGGISSSRKNTRRGRTRGRGGKRGRRSFRPRQVSENRGPIIREMQENSFPFVVDDNSKHIVAEESPRSYDGDDWDLGGESRTNYVEDDENGEGSESDNQDQASGDEYDDQGNEVDYDPRGGLRLLDEESEEDEDGEEDGEEDLRYRVGREELEVEDDEDEEIGDEEGDEDVANGDDDDGGMSQSSDYSED